MNEPRPEQRSNIESGFKTPPGVTFSAKPASLPNAIYGTLETDTLCVEIFGHSEAGRSTKRSTNQDYFYLPIEQPETLATGTFLFAVADGVGGASNGEKASEIAAGRIMDNYYATAKYGVNHTQAMVQAVQDAHQIVRDEGRQRNHTMATTFVGAIFPARTDSVGEFKIDFACVGDSRAYVLRARQGKLEQVTQDSLWYNDEQELGGEQAKWADQQVQANPRLMKSPRTIGGITTDLKVDFFDSISLREGDIVLLCTDGLYKPLGETEGLEPILQQNSQDLNAAAAIMFNAIHRRGRLDDTTIILIRVRRIGDKSAVTTATGQTTSAGAAASGAKSGSKLKGGIITTAIVLVLLLAGLWLFGGSGDTPGNDEGGNATVTAAVVALDSGASALDAYPTETPTSTATPSPIPTETPTETPAPTATPTEEATPTVPPEETVVEEIVEQIVEEELTEAEAPESLPQVASPTSGDCVPGACKYPNPPGAGKPAAGAIYDSPDPFEFGWSYISLGLDEYFDIRIYDSPDAPAPVKALAVKDRNFIQAPIELPCQEYFWTIRIASAGSIQPNPAVEGLVVVQTADYTGSRSPESERRSLIWKVGCPDQSSESGEGGESSEATE